MFGLSFLYPLFLAAAAAAAIPIALHLFRRRTEVVVDFPAVTLLQGAPVHQQRRRRLREVLLLALRVAALVLLAFAFARPYLASTVPPTAAPVTLVAVDTSMSLSAPGQFDRARALARAAVNEAPAGHLVGLLTFDDAAAVAAAPTADRAAVLAALDALGAGAGGTRFRTALGRAAELIGARAGRLVVVTDLQQAGWDAADEGAVRDGLEIDVRTVAPPASNLAVTSARRDGSAVVAAIHNFGGLEVTAPVRLLIDGQEAAVATASLGPHADAHVRFDQPLPARGGAQVVVEDVAGYQPDNHRYLVLDPPAPIRVAVIVADPAGTTGGLYLERALAAADEGRLFEPVVIDGRAFSSQPAEALALTGAVIIAGSRTIDRAGRQRLRDYLDAGGQMLLTLGPDVDVPALADLTGVDLNVHEAPVSPGTDLVTLVAADTRHPIFRPFASPSGAIGDVYLDRYRRLTDQESRTILARYSGGGVALTEQRVGAGRLLIFTSDLDNQWNRLPLSPAFVPLAIETARYLTQGRETRQAWVLPDVPPGVDRAPGIVGGPAGGATVPLAAVNVDVRESNPTVTSVDEFRAGITRVPGGAADPDQAAAAEQEEQQRLWQIGLLAMLIALAAEGVLGRKVM